MKCRLTICRLDPKSWRPTENDVFAKTSLEGRLSIQGLPFGPSNKTVFFVIYTFRGQARMFVVN
jgi:hypothetical protein